MNTKVPYHTPSHRNRWGQYLSTTRIDQNDVRGILKLHLTWFNSLGWYFSIELEAWRHHPHKPGDIILEHFSDKRTWRKGPEVGLCAQAAEELATELLKKHGIVGVKFAPYDLARKY